jgi:hypothetical protein
VIEVWNIKIQKSNPLWIDLVKKHETSVSYTPQQNDKAEGSMRTYVEAARTVLYSKNVSETLWAKSVNTVMYTINRKGSTGQDEQTH